MSAQNQNSLRRVFYFGVSVDYKYRKIIETLPIDYVPTNYVGLLKNLLLTRKKKNEKRYVHLRYILFRGYLTTFLMYAFLIAVCKVRGVKLVWSCHNIYEHGIPSKPFGNLMRGMLGWASYKIIVFHPSLKKYLGRFSNKVISANFGAFQAFIQSPDHPVAPEFLTQYREWINRLGVQRADIVFIGEYKARKNIPMLIDFAKENPDVNVLIIAVRTPKIENHPENLFVHSESLIFGELDAVLGHEGLIGFVAHDNLSVPTGIHLYADYGIPVLGVDMDPVACFIAQYGCGETFSDRDSLRLSYKRLKSNWNKYSQGIKILAMDNTWEKSADRHKIAFDL